MSQQIQTALAAADDTEEVVIGAGVLESVGEVYRRVFQDKAAILIADQRTMAVAGEKVLGELRQAGIEVGEPLVFPAEPELYARYENCLRVREALAGEDAGVIAVGAGSLNDLAKRACGELGLPYLVVGTAASMDGYTAFGASIAVDGYKQTMECPAPAAVIADLDVLAAAPPEMTASGYGDLAGKLTAGADWLLADQVKAEAVDPAVWDLVQGLLRETLAGPDRLAAGGREAVGKLAEGLVMSGLAMQAYHGSRPASGSEHLFSHLWEMEGHGVDITPRRLSHGFKVAVGAVAITALYEALLADDLRSLDIDAAVATWPDREALSERVRRHHQLPGLREAALQQTMTKYVEPVVVGQRLTDLAAGWDRLRDRLTEQLIPATELQQMLRAAGAPAHPAEIGLDWNAFIATYQRSQLIRSRYTVLDTLAEAGLLLPLVDRLFAPDGFWGKQAPVTAG